MQTRETKQGGAWMDGFMLHHRDANNNEILPEVIIAGNFPPAIGDTPSLLPLSNISTLFHEMGHALHGLLTQVDEFDVAGTEVAQDVVEFPSQFFEAFWMNPAVLKRLGRHYKTGEVIPDVLIERIIAADRFQKAMFLIRQLEFGLFDMELHLKNGADATQVQQVLNSVRDRFAVVKYPPYNKFQCAFNHIFSWDYSAGYYSYLWAESMAADAYMAFDGNPFNKELSYKYRDTVLAMGGAKEMSEIYIDFMGREPNPESLLQMYGLK
jgi:oligopeptidase A